MYQEIHRWFTLRKFQWKLKRDGNEIVTFNRALRDANNVLVCMPWNFTEFHVARYVQKFLSTEPDGPQVTYIVPHQFGGDIHKRPQDLVIRANGSSRDRRGVFGAEFEAQVLSKSFQVAADLSRTFDLGTSLLCWKTGAPLRIGIESPYSHLFFNMEVERPSNTFPLEKAYRNIQKMLDIESLS